MKFRLNKALLYKDWKTSKWVALLMFCCILYAKLFKLMSSLNFQKLSFKQNGHMFTARWFNNSLLAGSLYFTAMIVLVYILSLVLFLNEKNNGSYNLIFSMPFTRKDIIKNKWFLGTFIIIGSLFINSLLIALFYIANLKWIDSSINPFWDIPKWLLMDSTVYILLFTVSMFFQTIMGNIIFSSITGALTLLVPKFLTSIISNILTIFLKLPYDDKILVQLGNLGNILCPYTYNLPYFNWKNLNSTEDMYRDFVYQNFSLKLSISWILIILFLSLSLYYFSNRKLELNNKLVWNSKLEIALKWCVSICSGIMIGAFVGLGYCGENLIIFFISSILAIIIVYYIFNRIIKTLA